MTALPMLRRCEEASLPALRACWGEPPRTATVSPKPLPRQKVSVATGGKPASFFEKTDGTSPSARASMEEKETRAEGSRRVVASSKNTPAAKRRVGRPSQITRDKHNLIMTCLQLGQSRQVAAKTAGISPSTITRAMQRDPLFAADIAYAEEIGVLFRREFDGWLLHERRRQKRTATANALQQRPLQNTGSLPKGTVERAKNRPVYGQNG